MPKPSKKRITTREIGDILGLHYTTVAEALRNSSRISAKTRERVKKAAEELGYRPDPILSALNAYRSNKKYDRRGATIMWIDTYKQGLGIHGFNFHCMRGAHQRADELGYKLDSFNLNEDNMTHRRASDIILHRGIKGILIPPLDESVKTLNFDWDNFSAIQVGYSLRNSNLHIVSPDQTGNTIKLMKYLVQGGFKKIGFACPRWIDQRVNLGFISGYMGAHHNFLPRKKVPPVFQKEINPSTGEEFIQWVKKHKFEALVLHRNDDYESVLKKAGFKIPRDISLSWVTLFNNVTYRCGIMENAFEIGRQAINSIVAMLNRGEVGISPLRADLSVHGTINPGKTVRFPKSEANIHLTPTI